MKLLIILFVFTTVTLFSSCEKVIETLESSNGANQVVVEGIITNETKAQVVKLSRTKLLNSNEQAMPVSNALVTISDGSNNYILTEKANYPGVYQTIPTLKGELGKTYTLTIKTDGKIYSASDKMVDVAPLTPINYTRSDKGQEFYEWNVPKNYSSAPGTTYEWHTIIPAPPGSTAKETDVVYYNFTGLETSALFSLNEMSQTYIFKKGVTITQKKYSLSSQYYEFLKAIYTETDWKGSLYDSTPANAPTNLNNNALGFFRASAVTTLSQVIN